MRRRAQDGQAAVMVTVAATALFGTLGLAMDLGWAFYSRKSAQAAADAAAMAAAGATLARTGQGSTFACGSAVVCQPQAPCRAKAGNRPANPLDNGCLYAERNGFTNGSGGQVVTMESGVAVPPLAPGVNAHYWATARVGQHAPRLLAALFSGPATTASATAAIVEMPVYGSLVLLNRESDCLPMEARGQSLCGVDLLVRSKNGDGSPVLNAEGGILLASTKKGLGTDGHFAAESTGTGTVQAPFTYIRGGGRYRLDGSARWTETPVNQANSTLFLDPMRGKGQPPAPAGLQDRPVQGGTIRGGSAAHPLVLEPGNYFAANAEGTAATGEPVSIEGNVRFAAGASGFGGYVIYGGVRIAKPATVTFEPGVYAIAGVRSGALFSITAQATLRDLTAGDGQNADAGELFLFTDTNYRGKGGALAVPQMVRRVAGQWKQGPAGFQTRRADVTVNLHGLNRASAQLPRELQGFSPAVMWQDQANSVVRYTASGDIDTSCGNAAGCPNEALANASSTEMQLVSSPAVRLYGTVYQPRGGWISMTGSGKGMGAVQVIAGALRMDGGASFRMTPPAAPLSRTTVALVQ